MAGSRSCTAARSKGTGHPWYISFFEGCATRMRIVKDRSEAIGVACAMLDEGIEVTRVGPMLDTGQPEIDLASLRELCRQGRGLGSGRAR
jgi:hypothetical protein